MYPPGTYAIEMFEEPIEGMSFVGYRRTQTTIELLRTPRTRRGKSLKIELADLEAALVRDLETGNGKS